jgi:hypothetical protein
MPTALRGHAGRQVPHPFGLRQQIKGVGDANSMISSLPHR